MAKDHDKEAIHPPPQKEGKKRLAVSASNEVQSNTKCVEFDYDKYAKFLNDADLSDAEKLEHCRAVWNIMSEFVKLGYGVHPIQQACGKDNLRSNAPPINPPFLLNSEHKNLITEFDDVVGLSKDATREGVEV